MNNKTLIRGESLSINVKLDYDGIPFSEIDHGEIIANAWFQNNFRVPLVVTQLDADGRYNLYSDVDTRKLKGESFLVNIVVNRIEGDASEDLIMATFNQTFYIVNSATDMDNRPLLTGGHSVVYLVDGEYYACENYPEGATITPVAAPTREDYEFSGWSGIPQTMPDHCVVTTGSLTPTKVYKTISYYIDDVLWQTQQVEVGTEIVPLMPDEREDYHFGGWIYLPRLMPDEDITATGFWYGIVSTGYFGENDTAPYKIFGDGYMMVYGTGYIERTLRIIDPNYYNLVKEVDIKDGILGIRHTSGNNSLPFHTTEIRKINIPDSCNEIDEFAFAGIDYDGDTPNSPYPFDPTPKLDIILPNTVTDVGNYAFDGSNMIRSVTFGNRTRTIGYVWNSNLGIKEIVYPDSVLSVGTANYKFLTNLEEITFGAGLTSIGYSYFERNKLKKIVFRCSYNSVTMDIQWNTIQFNNPDTPILDVYYKNDGSWDSYIANAPSRLNWIPIEV